MPDLCLIHQVVILSVELLHPAQITFPCHSSDHVISQIEQTIDLSDPETVLVKESDAVPILAVVQEDVAICGHFRLIAVVFELGLTLEELLALLSEIWVQESCLDVVVEDAHVLDKFVF